MTGSQPIADYLSQVAAALPGPARARGDIIAELRSGLLDATDAYRAAGHSPGDAAAAAAAEFGDPRQVAAAFRPELAARQARRTALTLITTGPLVGLLWAAAATASHIGIHRAPPWQWHGMPPATPIAMPLFAAVFLTCMGAALLTMAATGPLTRWLPASPRTAPATAAIAGFAPQQPTWPSSSCSPASSPARRPPSRPRPSSPPPPPAWPGSPSPGVPPAAA